jgi:hypothetical protein
MSERKTDKWLYQFTVNKEVESDQTEETEINGEKVKITKKIKSKVPINFALKRPNRRTYEKADMFFGGAIIRRYSRGIIN